MAASRPAARPPITLRRDQQNDLTAEVSIGLMYEEGRKAGVREGEQTGYEKGVKAERGRQEALIRGAENRAYQRGFVAGREYGAETEMLLAPDDPCPDPDCYHNR